MTLDPRRAGEALAASAEELARVWRAGRASARMDAFPGLLDGLVTSFIATAGEGLSAGVDPAQVWPATVGVVRVDARDPARGAEELEAEWDLVGEVLAAALRALDAGEDAVEWAAQTVVHGRAGTRALPEGGAARVLVAHLHSDPAATRLARAGEPS